MKKYRVIYCSYLVFFAVFVYLIINVLSIMFLFDVSLKTRMLRIDYISRILLLEKDIIAFETYITCFGIKIYYYEYSNFINSLIFLTIIFGLIVMILLVFRTKFRKEIKRFNKSGFLFISFLVILILLLHHLPSAISMVGRYDELVSEYNRALIHLELIEENLYIYFFNVEVKNAGLLVSLVLDVVLYLVIGYIILLSIWVFVYQNKKIKIVYVDVRSKRIVGRYRGKN